jgi:hypothetical protein
MDLREGYLVGVLFLCSLNLAFPVGTEGCGLVTNSSRAWYFVPCKLETAYQTVTAIENESIRPHKWWIYVRSLLIPVLTETTLVCIIVDRGLYWF